MQILNQNYLAWINAMDRQKLIPIGLLSTAALMGLVAVYFSQASTSSVSSSTADNTAHSAPQQPPATADNRVFSDTQDTLLAGLGLAQTSSQQIDLKNSVHALSYAMGYSIGQQMSDSKRFVTPDIAFFQRGFREHYTITTAAPLLSIEKSNQLMQEFSDKTQHGEKTQTDASYQQNLRVSKEFLANNAKLPGIKTLASGIQYEVLEEGTGASPKITDVVTLNYRSKNIQGEEFQSSFHFQKPWIGPVYTSDEKAWEYVLPAMKEGAKWRVYAPNELTLNQQARPPYIKPGDAVVYDMELLKVKPNPFDLASSKSEAGK
jgi:FKBP-type peptidyl-prolyl cis-trans isomerase FklB